MLKADPRDKTKLIDPLFAAPGPRYWLAVLMLLAVVGWGVFMYLRQLLLGLGDTGMDRPTYWGVYMVNFIFFIGISHAGTLISAILRVTGAEWRRPITRVAEAITTFALVVGTLQIIIDMGRPDRLHFVILHGRLQSPILWDVVSVTAYFLGSVTYLYLPLIPDAAILRDNLPANAPAWRHTFYRVLALGWRGHREQAPGQGLRVARFEARQADLLHELTGDLLLGRFGHAADFEAELNILLHGEPRKKGVALKDHSPILARAADHIAVEPHDAPGWLHESRHDSQERTLPAPRRTQDGGKLLVPDFEGDLVNGPDLVAI